MKTKVKLAWVWYENMFGPKGGEPVRKELTLVGSNGINRFYSWGNNARYYANSDISRTRNECIIKHLQNQIK